MRWSKMKKQLEDLTCPCLKGRVEFWMTSYRKAHDQVGRAYITVDGKEVVNMSTLNKEIAVRNTERELSKRENRYFGREDIGQANMEQANIEQHNIEQDKLYQLLRKAGFSEDTILQIARKRRISDLAQKEVQKQDIFSQDDFLEAVERFLNSPIEESLASDHAIVKALALIDRRVGKRTLRMLNESITDESELVKYFYRLRCEAEQMQM